MTSCLVPFDVYVKGRTVKLCTEFDPDKTWNFQQFLFKSGSPIDVKVFRKAINSERMFKYSSMARIGLYFIGGFHTRQILKSRGIELPFLSSEDILKLTI